MNKEETKEYYKKYWIKNRDRLLAQQRKYQSINREAKNKQDRENYQRMKTEDPEAYQRVLAKKREYKLRKKNENLQSMRKRI